METTKEKKTERFPLWAKILIVVLVFGILGYLFVLNEDSKLRERSRQYQQEEMECYDKYPNDDNARDKCTTERTQRNIRKESCYTRYTWPWEVAPREECLRAIQ